MPGDTEKSIKSSVEKLHGALCPDSGDKPHVRVSGGSEKKTVVITAGSSFARTLHQLVLDTHDKIPHHKIAVRKDSFVPGEISVTFELNPGDLQKFAEQFEKSVDAIANTPDITATYAEVAARAATMLRVNGAQPFAAVTHHTSIVGDKAQLSVGLHYNKARRESIEALSPSEMHADPALQTGVALFHVSPARLAQSLEDIGATIEQAANSRGR